MPELLPKWIPAYLVAGPILLVVLELVTGALRRAFREGLKPENLRPYTSTNGMGCAVVAASLLFGPLGVAAVFGLLILEDCD